ncbi:hypothetical protein G7L40_20950 [Paenibacillus polymyxa]|uniref:Uncharacterized protein n=1 Tax=Paenibacillus polymyxa TaxID=1406 RepID=A0A378XZ70_PAEPO|nr:hypothetical protein [Paenibacillus polymyxa]MBE7896039.1 hypothetical protein [Paenibacillus polymyxa]MBG9765998.1 hypothetical protein [Paenibacillus polymyxa]MCC3256576.1 hypothetical protein [Paenibacillus polymyxa]QPK54937.1 hypothetical protein G7035_21000 [Paenibacillus polymyxa]QPK60026.1 hypothetical protein G7L40_20950 [Paenibacillus polymyxa]
MTTPNIEQLNGAATKNNLSAIMTTQEYPEGRDLAYDILRLLNKHKVSYSQAERILEKSKEHVKEYARLNE